jgi:SAM-dependent methyltransferase
MLKMYHRHAEPGGSAAYWEAFGSEGTLADRLRFCDVDPLRPLFLRYVTPGALMLEGGCGRGQYVAYYSARGATVIGLDFAREWLSAIHTEAPALRLCAGDVGALPFMSGTFDVYYSGGVVEHFESGADRALAEARRVLKPDGVLLISVPYFNPLRRALRFVKRGEWRRVASAALDAGHGGRGRFYQYAYTVREFDRLLASAGLRVMATQGYAILWGLYDIGGIRWMVDRFGPAKAGLQLGDGSRSVLTPRPVPESRSVLTPRPVPESRSVLTPRPVPDDNGHEPHASLLKRLLVAEDAGVPVAGWLVKAGRWACANMMMYVCTPEPRGARA